MVEDPFVIFVDRLKERASEKLQLSLPSQLFDIQEKDLSFEEPISMRGEVYLADQELVFHFSAETQVRMPCAICNQMIAIPLIVRNFYHTEPISELPNALFYPAKVIRDALLVELPQVVECNKSCPERSTLAPYLRSTPSSTDQTYFAFRDLKSKE